MLRRARWWGGLGKWLGAIALGCALSGCAGYPGTPYGYGYYGGYYGAPYGPAYTYGYGYEPCCFYGGTGFVFFGHDHYPHSYYHGGWRGAGGHGGWHGGGMRASGGGFRGGGASHAGGRG